MFKAYFDASGNSTDQLAIAVAGFIASVESWNDWVEEWLGRLRQDDLGLFHRRIINRLVESGEWPRARRERLLSDLAKIIRSHVSYKIGVVVVNSTFESALSKQDIKRWNIDAYSLAGRTAAKEVRIWAASWGGPMPQLVFERGDKGGRELHHLLTTQGYPAPVFKPKKCYRDQKSGRVEEGAIPLQAADLLAYEYFSRTRAIEQDGYITKQFLRLPESLDKIPGIEGIVNDKWLKHLKHGMENLESLILVPNVKINTR